MLPGHMIDLLSLSFLILSCIRYLGLVILVSWICSLLFALRTLVSWSGWPSCVRVWRRQQKELKVDQLVPAVESDLQKQMASFARLMCRFGHRPAGKSFLRFETANGRRVQQNVADSSRTVELCASSMKPYSSLCSVSEPKRNLKSQNDFGQILKPFSKWFLKNSSNNDFISWFPILDCRQW